MQWGEGGTEESVIKQITKGGASGQKAPAPLAAFLLNFVSEGVFSFLATKKSKEWFLLFMKCGLQSLPRSYRNTLRGISETKGCL